MTWRPLSCNLSSPNSYTSVKRTKAIFLIWHNTHDTGSEACVSTSTWKACSATGAHRLDASGASRDCGTFPLQPWPALTKAGLSGNTEMCTAVSRASNKIPAFTKWGIKWNISRGKLWQLGVYLFTTFWYVEIDVAIHCMAPLGKTCP